MRAYREHGGTDPSITFINSKWKPIFTFMHQELYSCIDIPRYALDRKVSGPKCYLGRDITLVTEASQVI
jgi:hypothetical protein